jgi:hypothetical protein
MVEISLRRSNPLGFERRKLISPEMNIKVRASYPSALHDLSTISAAVNRRTDLNSCSLDFLQNVVYKSLTRHDI